MVRKNPVQAPMTGKQSKYVHIKYKNIKKIIAGVKKKSLTPAIAFVILVRMEKIYERSMLYDFYGELLTEHQKNIFEEVVFDDLSLAEVAEAHNTSRQAVHDMVRRTTKTLENYEAKLGLVRKFLKLTDKVNEIKRLTDSETIRQLAEEILAEL